MATVQETVNNDDVTELIVWRGRVHHVGFRQWVERVGGDLNLKGIVYNLNDGRVAVQVQGSSDIIDMWVGEVKRLAFDSEIDERKEIPGLLLPDFRQLKTEGIEDLSEKFDVGIRHLENIKKGQEEGFSKVVEGQEEGFSKVVEGQEEGFSKVVEGQEEGFSKVVEGQEEGFSKVVEGQEEGFSKVVEGQEEGFSKVVEVLKQIEKHLQS